MKQVLQSQLSARDVIAHWMKWALLTTLLVMTVSQTYAQTIRTSECNCNSNAMTPGEGTFSDRIFITSSPNETWEVVSATGVYIPGSSPATVLPPGTEAVSTGANTYELRMMRISDEDYSVTLTDGTFQYLRTNAHTCEYPNTTIMGDFGTCVGTEEVYRLDVPVDRLENVQWQATGGTITFQSADRVGVLWGAAGSGTVSVMGQAYTNADLTGESCDFASTVDVSIMNEDAIVLACNNRINLTMGNDCQVMITPSLMLEDMMFTDDSYDLELRDIAADTMITEMPLTFRYLNTDIEVKVIHECSGNSCWGNIRLEDKSIPDLTCPDDVTLDCDQLSDPFTTGIPVPVTATISVIDDNTFQIENFDQCGGIILDYYDELTANLCSGPFSTEITRFWRATDDAGNEDTCSHRIFVNRATFDDLQFPPIYDDVLGANGGQPSLEACGKWAKLPNGYPSPEATGEPTGTFCLNVQVDYSDILIGGCSDEAYKIKRRWVVTDLCGVEDDREFNQIIHVADDEGPICSAPDEFDVNTDALSCEVSFDVPPPTVIFECSEWDYQVSYKIRDDSGDIFNFSITDGVVRKSNGDYTINGVDAAGQDSIWIIYTFMDECGNVTQCFTEANIVDTEEPVPVCDRYTFVALNEEGIAFAGPSALDDGSYDNCALDSMDVQRMDDACGETSAWGQKIKFCCDDVGNTVMVALRVFDASGNSNQCMVEVEVQDNIAPIITFCPADMNLDCTADLSDLSQYGSMLAEDQCGVTITETFTRVDSDCGRTEVVRTFTATDDFGNTTTCQQTLTLENQDPFFINSANPNDSRDDVIWPRDYKTNSGCLAGGLEPGDLPSANGFPTTLENICSRVSVTHDDVVFQYVDGACFKILRNWTIIDDCQFNPFNPTGGGMWEYTQVIEVTNLNAPTILTGCTDAAVELTPGNGCTSRLQVSATADDDCTPVEDLAWSYTVDLGDNGTIEFAGDTPSFDRTLEYTTARITWTVEDECGNISTCDQLITVDDRKKPTPYCLSEVVTVLMETDGSVAIWASDFDNGSFDNCSQSLSISFSANTNDTSMEFTCADVPNGIEQMIPVEIWVTDDSGNSDFCTATLTLQDNSDVCTDTVGATTRVSIAGRVATEDAQMVKDVEVMIMANQPEYPAYEMTDTDGNYAFADVLDGNDYILEPSKVDVADRGVSTLDLVMIQRHILGLSPLDSPYKVIAADVNGSESVSGADVVALRKLILGIDTDFQNNDSWRFVDASQVFDDVLNPFPFTERVTYADVDTDMMSADFVAVKIGDVNSSLQVNGIDDIDLDSRSAMILTGEPAHSTSLDLVMDKVEGLTGMQFTISYPADQVEIIDISSTIIDITPDNIGWQVAADGSLALSWHTASPIDIAAGEVLMTIELNDAASAIAINDDLLRAEAYTMVDGYITTQPITYRGVGANLQSFRLFQNVPNPFDATTEISFELPAAGPATLSVYDINGRLIKEVRGDYAKGLHSISLDVNDLDATGILYYQLDSKTHTASKKMVVIR